MEEINLKDLFSYFFSKIFIVIITFVLAISTSLVYSNFIKEPKSSSLFVGSIHLNFFGFHFIFTRLIFFG